MTKTHLVHRGNGLYRFERRTYCGVVICRVSSHVGGRGWLTAAFLRAITVVRKDPTCEKCRGVAASFNKRERTK